MGKRTRDWKRPVRKEAKKTIILGIGGLAVLGAAVSLFIWKPWAEPPKRLERSTHQAQVSAQLAELQAQMRREQRPTLSPSLFTGKAAWAHEIAREIPNVLDQLRCYCGCDKHAGHVSLLSCYTDGHAAT